MPTWTAPTTRSSGDLITASIWNTDLVANLGFLKDAPVIDTAVILGAATTSGIRLDLESGTLAVREGDDSAYGPLIASVINIPSTGSINFASSDVTITHSTNTLAFAGASTAYTFADGPVRPATNDGAALGVSGTAWSDLFLASGGVINFNAGDVTITHAADKLTFGGANYVFTDGNVGIGETSPSSFSLEMKGSGNTCFMQAANSTASHKAIYGVDAGVSVDGAVAGSLTNHAFVLRTNNTERMRITSGGRVAINTTSPDNLFEVRQTADNTVAAVFYQSASSPTSGTAFYIQNDHANGIVKLSASGDAAKTFSFLSGATERARITSGGDLAIGATAKLYLDGVAATGNTYITESAADTIRIYTGGTDRFVLSTTQCYINLVYSQTTASAANVNVAADGLLARSTSSIRYKHDIDTLDSDQAMAAVMAMRPVTYRGKDDADQRHHVGFIAEEMAEIAPLLCTYDDGGESGTPNYVTYDRVTAYLVAVVQQQQAKIAALEARLN